MNKTKIPRITVFLFLTIILGVGCLSCSNTEKPKADKLLLISFDGFRHDYLSQTETPNFDKLVKSGVISEGLIPIFPSKTFPNHYSIATGLYAESSGFIGNNMYDSVMNAHFTMRNREAVENPDWYGGEPIWNTAEKNGKQAGTMFWVGSEAPIQNMRPTHWKKYEQSMPDSARIDTVIKWLDYGNEKEVDFATLYYHFPDYQGHRFGPDSEEVKKAIRIADNLIGYLINKLEENGLRSNTNLLIVSDHGMAEVSRERIVVLDEMIDVSALEIISYSPAIMANVKNGKLNEVYNALKAAEDNFRVYKKDEIPERYHIKNHHRVPELLLVADLGYTINNREYFDERPNYPSGGTHGFDPIERDMHSIFVANGPDLKSGQKMKTFQSIHLYELMAHLLNIPPAPNDGSIDSVKSMLN